MMEWDHFFQELRFLPLSQNKQFQPFNLQEKSKSLARHNVFGHPPLLSSCQHNWHLLSLMISLMISPMISPMILPWSSPVYLDLPAQRSTVGRAFTAQLHIEGRALVTAPIIPATPNKTQHRRHSFKSARVKKSRTRM